MSRKFLAFFRIAQFRVSLTLTEECVMPSHAIPVGWQEAASAVASCGCAALVQEPVLPAIAEDDELAFDQRGDDFDRIVDSGLDDAVDIGAFELAIGEIYGV
jgi:hypothetical protein